MPRTKEAYAAKLLTTALSANREEYARPYSTQEYYALTRRVKDSAIGSIGELPEKDIGVLMMYLGLSEEESYRVYTLLNRGVQMAYALEKLAVRGVTLMTCYDDGFPSVLKPKLRDAMPPCIYAAGNTALAELPALAIMGISGVKTHPDLRDGITRLVRRASELGWAIITGGEPGVSRIAAATACECGGRLIDIPGGAMLEHLEDDTIARMRAEDRCLVLCTEHPEAMFTVSHAIARNKLIFSLSNAAIVCNTDNKRGEIDALNNHYCRWIYAWSGWQANQVLISRGAIPVTDLGALEVEELALRWRGGASVQLSMFDDEFLGG